MRAAIILRQGLWLVPFLALALFTLALSRPSPHFPRPAAYRLVTDADGIKVPVPLPARVIRCNGGGDFLETTHAPEALFRAGNAEQARRFATSLLGRIYPEVAARKSLWSCPDDLETILAEDQGAVYLPFGMMIDRLRRLGLPVVALVGKHPVDRVLIEAAVLGHEAYGESLLARERERWADLRLELQPDTLKDRPRALFMGSSPRDWSNVWSQGRDWLVPDETAGITSASEGFHAVGRQQEAERILAMDPDIIFSSPDDIFPDPRWQGLKAVRAKKVYTLAHEFRGMHVPLWRFDFKPLTARWIAEIAHPDRLQPRLRDAMRNHYINAYNYRLSDEEIDNLLRMEENRNGAGYERFSKPPSDSGIGHLQ